MAELTKVFEVACPSAEAEGFAHWVHDDVSGVIAQVQLEIDELEGEEQITISVKHYTPEQMAAIHKQDDEDW